MYWKARLESMCGIGAESGAAASGGTGGVVRVSACGGTTTVGWASVPREQETSVTIPRRYSNPINHQGHEGSRRFSAIFSLVNLRVLGGVMVFSVILCVLVVRSFSPRVSCAGWDARERQCRCSERTRQSWARRKYTCSGY